MTTYELLRYYAKPCHVCRLDHILKLNTFHHDYVNKSGIYITVYAQKDGLSMHVIQLDFDMCIVVQAPLYDIVLNEISTPKKVL